MKRIGMKYIQLVRCERLVNGVPMLPGRMPVETRWIMTEDLTGNHFGSHGSCNHGIHSFCRFLLCSQQILMPTAGSWEIEYV
jgi:hypothetical protein